MAIEWRYFLNGEPFGSGNTPSEWSRSPWSDLGCWPRVLLRRGRVYRWAIMIPGHGPRYPVVEAKRVG